MPDLTTPNLTDPTGSAPPAPPCRRRFTKRQIIGYIGFVLLLGGLFIASMLAFYHYFEQHQRTLNGYAAQRALTALDRGQTDVSAEVDALLADVPIYQGGLFNQQVNEVWEGQVLRNRVDVLRQLTGRLFNADHLDQAEAVLWKAQFEFHVASRVLELLDLWELMDTLKAASQDWVSVFQITKILAAHGAATVHAPSQLEPFPLQVDPARYGAAMDQVPPAMLTALNTYDRAQSPAEFGQAASLLRDARSMTKNPVFIRALDNMIHRALIQSGDLLAARGYFGAVWGRDPRIMDSFWRQYPARTPTMLREREPSLLEMTWRDRPATSTLTVSGFLDSFYGDSRVRVMKFDSLKVDNLGYFNLANDIMPSGSDRVVLGQAVACHLEGIRTEQPVHQLVLAYEATSALEIYPILLVRVDHEPYIPVYLDSTAPSLVTIETDLAPGEHTIQFVYLNDASFNWPRRQIKEDRNLMLYRLALVQVPPMQVTPGTLAIAKPAPTPAPQPVNRVTAPTTATATTTTSLTSTAAAPPAPVTTPTSATAPAAPPAGDRPAGDRPAGTP